MSMHIGLYATNEYPTPLPPGSIHGIVSMSTTLVTQLTKLGHHVDLFCTTESRTSAHKRALGYRAFTHLPIAQHAKNSHLRFQYSIAYSQRMIADIIRSLSTHPVDVMHWHSVHEILPLLFNLPAIPKIITIHESLFAGESQFSDFHRFCLQLYRTVPGTYFVSISKRQQQGLINFPFFANVYNGIDTNVFRFNPHPKNYLFFSGRFIPEKGIDIALQAAQRAKQPMTVVGMFDQRLTVPTHFKQIVIRLLRSPSVDYHNRVTLSQLANYYGQARAVLVPIQWEEPFGLVMAEAMACGTPVIAFKRGAAPELIRDGKTGFIVRTLPEMVRAIKKIPLIKRQACRDHVEKYFSLQTMARNYERVYQAAIRDFKRLV